MRILSNLSVSGLLGLNSVADANTDTDKFLVLDSSGIVRYRTGAEVFSDIGAGGAAAYTSVLQHTVKAGEALTKGQAVYVTGADGTNMIVGKASNATEATSSKTLGLIAQNLATNDQGFVVTEGLLAGIDTSTAQAGDPVWLGTNGNLIFGLANKPYAPTHMVFIGIVTRAQQNNGEIFVKVQNGFELQELHNVQITSTPADNTVLAYETSTSLYKMKSIPTLLGYTPVTNARSITINGTTYDLSADRSWSVGTHTGNLTTGYVPKATGATTLTDSLIYDNGSGIGINTSSPYESSAFKLDVNGGLLIKNTSGTTAQLVLINSNPATGGNNGFVQLSAGGNTATAFGQWQTYYGMSVAAGALRLQPSGGQVLIGTTTTSAFLTDINGTLRVSGQLTLGSTISNNTYVYTMPGATGTLALLSDIPSLSGYVPTSRTITINGVSYDLSADRSWSVTSMVYPGAGIAVSTGSSWGTSITDNSSNWNAAYSWGNHASAGYLTASSAASTYLTISNASSTYLTQSSANTIYLNKTDAASTYLSQSSANTIYLNKNDASSIYLSQSSASTIYLSIGNASSTYLSQSSAALTYVSFSGSYSNPSWITSLAWSKITGAPAFLTSYTETDTLATVTARGATTSTATVFTGGLFARRNQTAGDYTTAALWTESYGSTATGIAFHISGNVGKFLEMRTNGILYWHGDTVWHSGNLTNLNQLSNGPGYITGYTETDTLASVTGRGANTTSQISINLQTTINTTTPGLGTGYGLHFGGQTTADYATGITFSAGNATATNANAGIYVQGAGAYGTRMYIATTDSYATGAKTAISISEGGIVNIVRGALQQQGYQVLHANNYTSYSPSLTGSGASGTWGISITGNAATLGGYGPNQTGGAYTIVQRDANGYIQNSYFYMSGGGSERNSSGLGYIAGFNSSDYYVRSYNSTAVASFLGLGSMAYASTGSYLALSGGTMSGSFGLNDQKLYLRTNGDNNHYLWNAADDWEELNAYEGTGFRITSNAGSTGVLYVYGSSNGGYTYSPYSFRAPIFYDSQNTGYYGDFDSTSNMYRIQLGGGAGGTYAGLTVQAVTGNTGPIVAKSLSYATVWSILPWSDGDTYMSTGIYYDNGTWVHASSTSTNALFRFRPSGPTWYSSNNSSPSWNLASDAPLWNSVARWVNNVTAPDDVRAPIFYDSQDTSYYLDPNGSSVLNGTVVIKGNDNQLAIDGTTGGLASGLFFRESGNNKYELYHYSGEFRFYNYTTGQQELSINNASGYVTARTSFRAPIFYDSQDTNYYVDPNGMSKQVQLTNLGTYGSNAANARNHFVQYNAGTATPATGWIAAAFGDASANRVVIGQWGSNTQATIGSHTGSLNDWAPLGYAATEHIFYAPSWTSSEKTKINSNGIYAPAYRGNDNVGGTGTATWHPDGIYSGGTEWLYGTMYRNGSSTYYAGGWEYQVGGIEFNSGPSFQVNNSRNLQLNSGGAADVGIYGRGNGGQFAFQLYGNGSGSYGFLDGVWAAWDLRKAVDGSLYMNDNDSYYLNTTSNSYVYRLESATDLRAPIFYDSQDTAYYLDPNSESSLYRFTTSTYTRNGMNYLSINSPFSTRSGQSSHYQNGTMGWGTTDFNTIGSYWGSGFIDTWSNPGNAPGGSSHYVGMQAMHYNDQNGNFHGWQMACAQESTNRWFWRSSWNIPNRPWVEMIHSGNIGSQSVNYASSAGSADNIDGWSFVNTGSNSGTNADTIASNGISYATSNVNLFGQTDGALYSQAYSSDWQHQIYGDYRTGQLAVRGKQSGTWQAWRVVLDSSNYTSYALPLSGGTIATNGFIDFGPNSTWGSTLRVGGNGHGGTTRASVCTTNGNLHLDGGTTGGGGGVYLNAYHNGPIYATTSQHLVLHAGNIASYTAGNVNSISSATGGSYNWTGINYFVSNRNTTSDSPPLQAYSNNGSGAIMSFHRGGYYAVNFGLDSDNVMRIGGWSASANRWQLDMSGNMTVAGDVTAYSDARVKENVHTVDNALSKVLALRGVYYNRTDSEDKNRKIGVIAQETMTVIPEVVNQDNAGMYNVSYGNLGGLFIEAFKEQQKKIEAQDIVIEELKAKLDAVTK